MKKLGLSTREPVGTRPQSNPSLADNQIPILQERGNAAVFWPRFHALVL